MGGNLAQNIIVGVLLGAVLFGVIALVVAGRRQEMRDKKKKTPPEE